VEQPPGQSSGEVAGGKACGSGAMSGAWTLLFKYSTSVLINTKGMFWSNGKFWLLYSLFGNAGVQFPVITLIFFNTT